MGCTATLYIVPEENIDDYDITSHPSVDVDKSWQDILLILGGGTIPPGELSLLFTGRNKNTFHRYHDSDDIELIYNSIYDIDEENIDQVMIDACVDSKRYEKSLLRSWILEIVKIFTMAYDEDKLIVTRMD